MKRETESIPEFLNEHARAVWAAKILAANCHRNSNCWIVLTTEEFIGSRETTKIEVMPKDRLSVAGLIAGWTADEAYAIAKSYL